MTFAATSLLLAVLAQAVTTMPPSFGPADVVAVERYSAELELLRLRDGTTRLVPAAGALQKVVRLGLELDQARDDLAVAREAIAAGERERALQQQVREMLQSKLDDEKRHSEQLYALGKAQQDGFAATLAELKAKSDAEAAAHERVIRRLKGNAFMNAVRTGAKLGVGIGIGIAIGRVLQ